MTPKRGTKPTAPSQVRMYLTLTPECHEAFRRFSEASGIAAATFASKLLQDAIPMVEALTRSFELAAKNPALAADELSELLTSSMVEAAQAQLDLEQATKSAKLRRSPRRRD